MVISILNLFCFWFTTVITTLTAFIVDLAGVGLVLKYGTGGDGPNLVIFIAINIRSQVLLLFLATLGIESEHFCDEHQHVGQ